MEEKQGGFGGDADYTYFYSIISTFKPTITGNVAQGFDALLSVLISVQVSKFLRIFFKKSTLFIQQLLSILS